MLNSMIFVALILIMNTLLVCFEQTVEYYIFSSMAFILVIIFLVSSSLIFFWNLFLMAICYSALKKYQNNDH